MATHTLSPSPHTLVGFLDPERAPVLTIDSGDELVFSTLDASWHLPEQERVDAPEGLQRWPDRTPDDRGHALVGPIEVRGARPGQALRIHLDRIQAGSWGWGGAQGDRLARAEALGLEQLDTTHLGWRIEQGVATSQHGDVVPVRPFLGFLGMPPPEPGRHSTFPPRRWGGNLDCRDLTEGAWLELPVSVPGALLHLGDGHAAQAGGETSGVAIECPLSRVVLRVELVDHTLTMPRFLTAQGERGCLAVAPSLDEAWPLALRALIDWVATDTGRSLGHVTALSSVFADLRITQVVNGTVGVHAVWLEG